MEPVQISREKNEASTKRYASAMNEKSKMGEFDKLLYSNKITAEYDTWSWYYTELSSLRGECSRLGLLVRVNDKSSLQYLTIYNAHIISFLNMLYPLVPDDLWTLIITEWNTITAKIETHKKQIANIGYKPIEVDLINQQDGLYRAALKIAQRLGLGFKTTLSDGDSNAIKKAILGE